MRRDGSAKDFPYDVSALPEHLSGLDKLRAVRDRELAQVLYELYWAAEEAERSGEARRWRVQAERGAADQLRESRLALAEKALRGGCGVDARQLAEHLLVDRSTPGESRMRDDDRSLEVFATELRQLQRRAG